MRTIVILAVSLSLLAFGIAFATGLKTDRIELGPEDAERVSVSLGFGAGELTITPADMKPVVRGTIEYNPDICSYEADYYVKGRRGYLDMESERDHSFDTDDDENVWALEMSTRYPTVLELSAGACKGEFDLGGIPLEEFELEVGAADCEIDFSKPNPIEMEEFSVEAGATSLEIRRIGNARCREFNFSGGVGSFELDFTGAHTGKTYVEIEVGLGAADIVLPRNAGVRIETDGDGWFSEVDIDDRDLIEIRDGVFESEGFDSAETQIVVNVEVGMGSVDVEFK